MPKIPKIKLAAEYLLKLAEEHSVASPEEQAHEEGETPEHEALEHLHSESEDPMSEYPEQGNPEESLQSPELEQAELPTAEGLEHEESGEGHDDSEVEQLISQLTPEQLDHLAAQLSEDIQHPGQSEGEDTAALAQAIQEHLAQNPEASLPEADPEKTASLNLIKSAEYIEGFLNEAIYHGATIKEAVDLYDSSLVDALSFVKTSEYKKKENFKDTLGSVERIKESSFLAGFEAEANNLGLTSEEAASLYKASSSLTNLFRRSGEAVEATQSAYRYAAKKPGRLKALLSGASDTAKKFKSKAIEKAKDITQRMSRARDLRRQTHISGASGESARANVRKPRKDSQSFESPSESKPNTRRESPNPFKPNISGPPSKQRTKTTQNYEEVKKHEKTASTADKLLKLLGRKQFNSLVQAVEDGGKLKGFRPANMKGDAFSKAIEDVRRNYISTPAGASAKPHGAATKGGGHPKTRATPEELFQRQTDQYESLLRKGRISPEQYLDKLRELQAKHLKMVESAPAAEPIKFFGAQPSKDQADLLKSKLAPLPAGAPRARTSATGRSTPAGTPPPEGHLAGSPSPEVPAPTEYRGTPVSEEAKAKARRVLDDHQRHTAREVQRQKAEEHIRRTEEAYAARQLEARRQMGQASEATAKAESAAAEKIRADRLRDAQAKQYEAEKALSDFTEQTAAKNNYNSAVKDSETAAAQASKNLEKAKRLDVINEAGVENGRIKGMSRSEQNKLLTEIHDGKAPTVSDTFTQAFEGSKDPRMRGISHNLAARMGSAGKVIADNPLTSATAAGAGAVGLISGAEQQPTDLPMRYRQPIRQSRPQPPQQFS